MTRADRRRLAIALALAAGCQVPVASAMEDPTRPPPVFASPDIADDAVRGPVLQSIMITPHGRWAIISGQRVGLGARYGDARLSEIGENEVILRSGSGTNVLKLYPDVNMKTAKSAGKTTRKPQRERN